MNTILITGSSSGIGKAIAQKLLTQGDRVIGIARDHSKFNPNHANYTAYTIDLNNVNACEAQFKLILKENPSITTVIASAGYGHFAELEQFSVTQMQQLMNVNFLSQAVLIKTFLPHFKTQKTGKVIIIASECALTGQKKGSIYCASKFALRGFAQSIRQECNQADVAITVVNPGMVATPFFDALHFKPGPDQANAITATQVADTIAMVMAMPTNCVVEEINLQPMKRVIAKQ